MGHPKDYTGLRYGHLVMLERAHKYEKNGSYYWKCKCDCGNITYATPQSLRSGRQVSCGCVRRESARNVGLKNATHHETNTRLFNLWNNILLRCENHNAVSYKRYGGRGIKVCPEWHEYTAFRDWALSHGYNKDAKRGESTIDRIDNNGDYEPGNCRFVSMKGQNNNRRNNVRVEYNGESHTISEWAEITGIRYSTLYCRYTDGVRGSRLFAKKDLRLK